MVHHSLKRRLYLFRNVKSDQTEDAVTTVHVKAAGIILKA